MEKIEDQPLKNLRQANRHNPDAGVFGDCERTAYAVLLGLSRDEVPHWLDGVRPDDTEGRNLASAERSAWLADRGLTTFQLAWNCGLDDVLTTMANVNGKDFCYLLSGQSRNGCNHVVVCRGDKIEVDTSIDQSGIVGPCDDGYFWVEVFVPFWMRRPAMPQEESANG